MTNEERKVMELALDFISRLQFADAEPEPERVMETIKKALDRIDAAPVAKNESGRITWLVNDWPQDCLLYTTPPQRKPLKFEEMDAVIDGCPKYHGRFSTKDPNGKLNYYELIRAIEAAHGIKE